MLCFGLANLFNFDRRDLRFDLKVVVCVTHAAFADKVLTTSSISFWFGH